MFKNITENLARKRFHGCFHGNFEKSHVLEYLNAFSLSFTFGEKAVGNTKCNGFLFKINFYLLKLSHFNYI